MNLRMALVLTVLLGVGCGGGSDNQSVDEQVSDTVNDTDLMGEATAAANEVIRNAADCTIVQDSVGAVNDTLDEIESKIQTQAGRTSLQSLRTQVKNVADACGAR